mgnify:CR=1 FL=1
MPSTCVCGHLSINHGRKNGCSKCRILREKYLKEFSKQTDSAKMVFKRTPKGKLKGRTEKERERLFRNWLEEQDLPQRIKNCARCPCMTFDYWYSGTVQRWDGRISVSLHVPEQDLMLVVKRILDES